MLLPQVLENGNDVPIPLSFANVGFRLYYGRFSHILLGRYVIGRLVGYRNETGGGKPVENGEDEKKGR